jgi:hypothetical protein
MIDDGGNTTREAYWTRHPCGFNPPLRKVPYPEGVTIMALLHHVLK